MKPDKALRSLGASFVIAAIAVSLSAPSSAWAETCLRMVVSASGSTSMWNNEAPARESAIVAWSATAARDAGADYATWAAARSKTLTCAPVAKSTVRCTAKATPCKP